MQQVPVILDIEEFNKLKTLLGKLPAEMSFDLLDKLRFQFVNPENVRTAIAELEPMEIKQGVTVSLKYKNHEHDSGK